MRPGARVLLVNADDFGIYPAANAAVMDAIDHGIAASCSVMVLGPGAPGATPDAGLTPTQLDWHCLADGGRADIFDVTLMLADEYGIAVRAWLEPARRKLRDRGLPVVGHDFSWVRQTDHEFLASGRAREVVEEEGITVIGWPTLLEQWQHPPGTAPAR